MKKRYSYLIKPLKVFLDVFIINAIINLISDNEFLNIFFLSYIAIYWLLTSYLFGFYKVFRYTGVLKVLSISVKQFLMFILGYFAYFGIFKEGIVINNQFRILIAIVFLNKVIGL